MPTDPLRQFAESAQGDDNGAAIIYLTHLQERMKSDRPMESGTENSTILGTTIDTLITKRLLDFYDGLLDRKQISPPTPVLVSEDVAS